jgi:hypothetical protein
MKMAFSLSNLLVLPLWVLMILFPHWRWTRRILQSPFVVVPPAAMYAALVLPRAGTILRGVTNPKLPEVAALLGTPDGATIGWAHFLTFDLFVGRWVYLDSRERHISAWLMAPVLVLILLLGPLGLLMYLGVRTVVRARHQQCAGAPVVPGART